MKNKKLIFAAVGAAVVIIVIIVLAVVTSTKKNPEPTNGPIAQQPDTSVNTGQNEPAAASQTRTITNDEYGFLFTVPYNYQLEEKPENQTFFFNPLYKITLPDNYYSGTNLYEATLVIGADKSQSALDTCWQARTNIAENFEGFIAINGDEFQAFKTTDVGAGNLYETISYRLVKNNTCYEMAMFFHSGNIGNYPEGTVSQFDKFDAIMKLKPALVSFGLKN